MHPSARFLPAVRAAALTALAVPTLWGAIPAHAAPPSAHALTGGRVVTAPGQSLENATLLIRDGVVEAVGENLSIPADARVWELEGATVYPGLIDLYSEHGWPEDDPTAGLEAEESAGSATPAVHPERSMATFLGSADLRTPLREAGFTTALITPEDGILRGSGALLALGEGPLREQLLVPAAAQAITPDNEADGGYPSSLMGSIAVLRQTFLDARWYGEAHAAYRADPAQARPPWDASLEALGPAARGEVPVIFEAGSGVDSVLRTGRLARELEVEAWLVGNGAEYRRLVEVEALGLPLLLPVAFPEAPAGSGAAVELDELRHWDQAPGNPARLAEAGVDFALVTHGLSSPGELHGRVATALERGLTADQALAALTTTPARLLGLEDRLGTLAPGKAANFLVVGGDLFVESPEIREVWIDGRRHELRRLAPPEVEPAGTWELTVDAGGEQVELILELTGKAPRLDGTLSVQGQSIELTEAVVSGKTLEVAFPGGGMGMAGTFNLTLAIDGDRATGSGVGPPGDFTLRGRRVSRPEPEPERLRDRDDDHGHGHPHPSRTENRLQEVMQ